MFVKKIEMSESDLIWPPLVFVVPRATRGWICGDITRLACPSLLEVDSAGG
jgi:hypothetical protein